MATLEASPLSLSSCTPVFVAERDVLLYAICLCPPWVPAQSSARPRLFAWRGERGEKEEALTLCQHCSAIAKTLLCYQHFLFLKTTNPKRSTVRAAIRKVNSIPAYAPCCSLWGGQAILSLSGRICYHIFHR